MIILNRMTNDSCMQDKSNERAGNDAKRWRALVVDGLSSTRRSVSRALSALGGEITTSSGASEAIELVQLADRVGLGFDFVVIDTQTPVNGADAARRIRELGFGGRIVAIV